jgi:hypothetical protein
MQRRTLIKVGTFAGALLAVAGAGIALTRPALHDHRLTVAGRELFAAVARAVLEGTLPADPQAQASAIAAHLERLDTTLSGMPPALQAEVAEMATLLAHPVGRMTLAAVAKDWPLAATAELGAALQGLRTSNIGLRQQVFHALRDLTNAAYFADASTWSALGYAGPRPV